LAAKRSTDGAWRAVARVAFSMTTTKMLGVLGVGVAVGAGVAVADSVGGGDGGAELGVATGGEAHDAARAATSAR
jgi:hypothetical protein